MTQEEAFQILKLGHNVFLTGSAGSGKTYLLNRYIDFLRSHGVPIAVTASTGIAATHIGGITIHSWSGLGIKDHLSEWDIEDLQERKYLYDRFQKTKVLIIDEVSMLHHFRLDLVDMIIRSVKRNDSPMGGMQVIFCGDFFQLPPVRRAGEPEARFVYESRVWQTLGPKICYLTEQHRQVDQKAVKVLNDIRQNCVTEETLKLLRTRLLKKPEFKVEPTKLYTHNIDVDTINERELSKIEGKVFSFKMISRGKDWMVGQLKRSCLAPETLNLKVGARVMFVKNNYEAGYSNGTLGTIVSFEANDPVVRIASGEKITAKPASWTIDEDDKVKAEISQVPLRLAWAITVHKSQGMSLDAAEIDLTKAFEKGMGYVALSRVRTLEGLMLNGFNEKSLMVHEDVEVIDKDFTAESNKLSQAISLLDQDEKIKMQEVFLATIAPPNANPKKEKVPTQVETKKLITQGLSVSDVAMKRKLTIGTVLSHLETLVKEGALNAAKDLHHLKPTPLRFAKIKKILQRVADREGEMKLAPARSILGESYTFEELRLARLFVPRK
ncbi:MAG: hypothetical protein A3H57_03680 [Candidatus Taylorbacteria bacterium RIFCSPLOWO2_02_FULL_43_11]|uniref:AAA+ ATPase domain-containing protein n=1 Tax=Candidatus Taylorbacteria bacterium RIFCSPHIGHO2_02_FULL_43_32b TaxID=1802306 RepID=A0A1G2MLN4_9BACT|nr:MAG: hypothetical protein A2743_04620 [Candidatus Taylorbacteria bacterium RIFCSPHIGHO2_01_FULL_43_47]OHA24820.1 MAG: hypothetical protein A3C72_03245 [Candidatus Taylorbacteria bacterium RIFCSPHIGHO2_02_FULL_43_32b]OHA31861.1 MAG: hypothetical protein A3B08_01120 [Candidatus Taylorbacteria bacterium RIFCSPLOWO2_01_FULL_43_44]OHA35654.1 MAG: hypothetical protein A3H57_03680 [Candidatus Taylorbacteria bacterium RIFCSPLOWO2_02_FULL_43_11]